jgi:hypothetical protein
MTCGQNLPSEVLTLVFQHLTQRDLLSCTYSCWAWNAVGNERLYYKVYGNSKDRFGKLIRTINGTESPNKHDNPNTRPRSLGQLIKVIIVQRDYYFHANSQWYPQLLSRLAALTPNVHSADIYGPGINRSDDTTTRFDWERSLSSKWRHLKKLRIAAGKATGDIKLHVYNMDNLFNRLHYLDIMYWSDFPSYLPPSPLVMSNIRSLKLAIQDRPSYDRLKEALQTCQDTLHTLTISWVASSGPLNVDDLIISLRQLKNFGFSYSISAEFTITTFGDHVEHLELIGSHRLMENEVDKAAGNAMMKSSNLKTLRIARCEHFVDYIPEVLAANSTTLQNLYFIGDSGDELLTNLVTSGMRFCNITTLSFECSMLDDMMAKDLAHIFPNVQFLKLTAGPFTPAEHWLTSETLAQFKYLKAIDLQTFRELLDRNSCTIALCELEFTLFLPDITE